LRVEYSVDSGATWKFIDTISAHAGADSLSWRVPNDTTHDGFVRVRTVDSSIRASNRTPIAITAVALPILRLNYPNGGELLRTDSTYVVRFTSNYTHGPIDVDYSIDSGATWRPIGVVATPKSGVDTLLWTTGSDTTRRALVRVRSLGDGISDVSNNVFSIRSTLNPKLMLTYPNGGQELQADSTVRIHWVAQDLTGQIRLQYSADNGASWNNVGQARTARNGKDSVQWRVPNDTTASALVRVMNVGGLVGDTSDAVFSITPNPNAPPPPTPTIAVLTQLTGAVLRGDSVVVVRWSAANVTDYVMLEYSPDSGSSWLPFHQEPQRSGVDSVNWTVPSDSTHVAVIRARNSDGTVQSRSGIFTVLPRIIILGVEGDRTGDGALRMLGAVPNPADGSTVVRWMQPERGDVMLRVYDARGTTVRESALSEQPAGACEVRVNLDELHAGSYRCEIEYRGHRSSVGVVVVR
ncbi:MAG: hypothetical protein H7X80_10065, partial [bacterium]|nr:hypothetical protein [Candidatus Kapabacteria bacterium]